MSIKALSWAWDQTTGNVAAKAVLLHLADSANHEDAESWYSINSIAERCECSKTTVRKHIKILIGLGLIEKVIDGGGHQTNRYRITFATPSESAPPRNPTPSESAPQGVSSCTAGGKELTLRGKESAPEPKRTRSKPKENPKSGKSIATWKSYVDAYRKRYGVDPLRNGKVNKQLCQLVDRVGEDAAPGVAEFYVFHNSNFYVKKMHPVGLLLADAEALHTQWLTNEQMTDAKARDIDQRQTTVSAVDAVIEKMGLTE